MKPEEHLQKELQKMVEEALAPFSDLSHSGIMTDIHVYFDQSDNVLTFHDDDQKPLFTGGLYQTVEDDNPEEYILSLLRTVIGKMNKSGALNSYSLSKPYSFVWTDEEGETLNEIALIDDDLVLLEGSFLMDLDKDLDDFLQHLLNDWPALG